MTPPDRPNVTAAEAGDAFLDGLPAGVAEAVRRCGVTPAVVAGDDGDEAAAAGRSFVAALPPSLRPALAALAAPDPPPAAAADVPAARYGLVECPDGEWPRLRLFAAAEELARHLGRLDGSDTIAWCFYGVPLFFTRGPRRYLDLPDGRKMRVPRSASEPCRVVPAGQAAGRPVEQSGYLGPPELADVFFAPSSGGPDAADEADDDADDDDPSRPSV